MPPARPRADGAIAAWGRPTLRIVVNCFLPARARRHHPLRCGHRHVLGRGYGHARTALEALGITRDRVDRVLITHLHGDHALGLFDGEAPYFPNARILVPATELSFFTDADKRLSTPENRRGGFAIAETLLRLYPDRVDAISGSGDILPGVTLIPLPGHTHGRAAI